jgi:hypothetical protein
LSLEFWSGTRCKKPFDDTMSELRLFQNINLCPLKKKLPKKKSHQFKKVVSDWSANQGSTIGFLEQVHIYPGPNLIYGFRL